MGSRTSAVALAGFSLFLGACGTLVPGVDRLLPPLVVISGKAQVPGTYAVADLRPAPRTFRVRLGPHGGKLADALAVGRIVDGDGLFTLSIPEIDLPDASRSFELQVVDPLEKAVLASPVVLDRSVTRVERDIDPATTVVALAARVALARKGDPTGWHLDDLANLPEVQAAVREGASGAPGPAFDLAALETSASGQVALAIGAILAAAKD